jgi:hypothetical protein
MYVKWIGGIILRLYIRHVIGGRLFLDTEKHQVSFQLSQTDGLWKFAIQAPSEAVAEEIVNHRHELNLFLVEEGAQSSKSWFYSKNGSVEYDKEANIILILADSRMDYPV